MNISPNETAEYFESPRAAHKKALLSAIGPELGIRVGRLRVLNLNEVNATQMCFEL